MPATTTSEGSKEVDTHRHFVAELYAVPKSLCPSRNSKRKKTIAIIARDQAPSAQRYAPPDITVRLTPPARPGAPQKGGYHPILSNSCQTRWVESARSLSHVHPTDLSHVYQWHAPLRWYRARVPTFSLSIYVLDRGRIPLLEPLSGQLWMLQILTSWFRLNFLLVDQILWSEKGIRYR